MFVCAGAPSEECGALDSLHKETAESGQLQLNAAILIIEAPKNTTQPAVRSLWHRRAEQRGNERNL
jgi:hypothetical protein